MPPVYPSALYDNKWPDHFSLLQLSSYMRRVEIQMCSNKKKFDKQHISIKAKYE